MTGIMLSHMRGAKVDLIDIDRNAIDMSCKMCEGRCENMSFICKSAVEVDYSKYDAVFVASMVRGKEELMDKLYKDGVEFVVIRDASGFSELFYEKLDDYIFDKYKIKDSMAANGATINSSYLLSL